MSGHTYGNVREAVTQERAVGRITDSDGTWVWRGSLAITPSLADLVETQIGDGDGVLHDVLDLVAVAEPLECSPRPPR
jgi:hypothetical protein